MTEWYDAPVRRCSRVKSHTGHPWDQGTGRDCGLGEPYAAWCPGVDDGTDARNWCGRTSPHAPHRWDSSRTTIVQRCPGVTDVRVTGKKP